jgi:branched-chain amino acid transport system substrate-binding protein
LRTLAVSLFLVCTVGCGTPEGPIRIGVAGPFSQPRGVSFKQAAQLAEQELNAKGGIDGRRVELVFADDAARDSVAVRVAQGFRADPTIVAVIGHLTSSATIAAVGVYGEESEGAQPLALISPSASSPDLSGVSRYFFRVCPSDLSHGPSLARYARRELGAQTAGVIYVNDDYGRGMRRTFIAEFVQVGGMIVADDPALPSTSSVEPYLSRMRRANGDVDVLVLATEAAMAERIMREMQRLGIRWPIIGGDALVGIQRVGPLAEGVRVTAAYLPDAPGDRNERFVQSYADAFDGQIPDHRGAGAFDIVHLLARAIAEAGSDRRAVRDYLASIGSSRPAFEGVTGSIVFNENGDVAGRSAWVGVVRGGRLITEAVAQ